MINAWIRELKAGDDVIIRGRDKNNDIISTVKEVTKNQIITSCYKAYYIAINARVNEHLYQATRLIEPTYDRRKKIQERVNRQNLIDGMECIDFDLCSIEQLIAITDILNNT